mgnify:CR=1 FL=1
MIIPLELLRAIERGYKGYNNRKYYICYKKKSIDNRTVWVLRKNKKY